MLQRFKSFVPLLVLALGFVGSPWLDSLSWLIPYIITVMLFLTFLKVRPRDIRLHRSHFYLLGLQLLLGALAYFLTVGWRADAATSMLLCFLTASASAGPSIVTILKGDTVYTTTYVLLSHLAFVVLVPFIYPYVSDVPQSVGLLTQMWHIFYYVARLILPAIVVAWAIVWLRPRFADTLGSYTSLSYSFWLLSLLLLIAHTTEYIKTASHFELGDLALMSGLGLMTCVLQYWLGHVLAPYIGVEQHAARHSLGQKNTSLSIWIAALFLPPLVGIGITSYIIWQNIIISLVMSRYKR